MKRQNVSLVRHRVGDFPRADILGASVSDTLADRCRLWVIFDRFS
jgi:hypothetical protein